MRSRVPILAGFFCLTGALAAMPDASLDASQHAERAAQCAQAGDMACAEAELRRAVKLAPNNASYLTSLGGILGMQQKLAEANVYFERAVKSDPNDAASRRNLAANEWRLGRLKQAQANLERLLQMQPQDKTAKLLLGMVSENEHNYARAAKLLGAVPELVNERAESIGALASAYYHTGRRDDAHRVLEELLGRNASSEGIFAAAGVAAEAGDYQLAEKLFESIRSRYPDATTLAYNLALIQFRTGRIAESQKTLLDLLNTGHAKGEVYGLLGRCYEKENNWTEAARALENAIRLNPAEESNYRDLVTVLINGKRLAAALDAARKMTEVFSQSAAAYWSQGMVEMKMNLFADAVRSYSRARELDPKSLDANVGLASANWAAGMRADAEREYQELLKQHSRDAIIYEAYGTSLMNAAGDDATEAHAAALLKRSIELDSSRPEPHYQLGMLELKKSSATASSESLHQALEQLDTAARLGLNDSRVHYALARVYRRLGRGNDAAKEMRLYQELKTAEDSPKTGQRAAATPGK